MDQSFSRCQPFATILLYIFNIVDDPFWFDALNIINVLGHGFIVFMTLCYYLLPHNRDEFVADLFDQWLIVTYFVLYLFNILSLYPLFHPLHSMTFKHIHFPCN